jgi:hypothetical protein
MDTQKRAEGGAGVVCYPPGAMDSIMLCHKPKGVLWMDVLKILLVIAVVIYLIRKDIFIHRFRFKASLKEGIEIDLSAKEKNDPPSESDRSNLD